MSGIKKRVLAVWTAALLLILCGGAAAENQGSLTYQIPGQEIRLPDGIHFLTIPADMEYQQPADDETDLKAIYLREPELEMLIFEYEAGESTVQDLAERMRAAGLEAQVREIGGESFLVFQDRDEADGAPCIGYSYVANGRMTEISFFYATQEAMNLTVGIMESCHP